MIETNIPDELIMNKILILRGMKVMIDSDLAELYGVTTKRLNEQVNGKSAHFDHLIPESIDQFILLILRVIWWSI